MNNHYYDVTSVLSFSFHIYLELSFTIGNLKSF